MVIKVTTSVPPGTYAIQLVVGEFDGKTYVARDKTNFKKGFIKGGRRP